MGDSNIYSHLKFVSSVNEKKNLGKKCKGGKPTLPTTRLLWWWGIIIIVFFVVVLVHHFITCVIVYVLVVAFK